MQKRLLFGGLISLLFLSSCDLINPEEKTPSFLRIEDVKLTTNAYLQGPNNDMITDAWVTVNGDFIGLFEMPFEIPVLQSGDVSIYVKPGIKNNGIAASRIYYPFYTIYHVDTVLEEMQTLVLTPTVKYYDEAVFSWIETFEDPGITIDTTSISNINLKIISDHGSRVGYIELNDSADFYDAETINSYEFPSDLYATFIEMDYQCNQAFEVGIYITVSSSIIIQPLIYLYPSEEWNKIYIDATYYAQTTTDAEDFKIYFSASKDTSIEQGYVKLDNIKLVHF